MVLGSRQANRQKQEEESRRVQAQVTLLDDNYLRDLIAWGGPVRIRCAEGYLIEDAVVKAVGTYATLIETPDGAGEELIFKHAIESVARMPEE